MSEDPGLSPGMLLEWDDNAVRCPYNNVLYFLGRSGSHSSVDGGSRDHSVPRRRGEPVGEDLLVFAKNGTTGLRIQPDGVMPTCSFVEEQFFAGAITGLHSSIPEKTLSLATCIQRPGYGLLILGGNICYIKFHTS